MTTLTVHRQPASGYRSTRSSSSLRPRRESAERLRRGLDPQALDLASVAAVGQLLVQEGFEQAGAVCDADGYLTVEGELCPICGRALRRTPDVLDELVQSVMRRCRPAASNRTTTTSRDGR
jgi:hypothetical protein